jgi:hypothetical protein
MFFTDFFYFTSGLSCSVVVALTGFSYHIAIAVLMMDHHPVQLKKACIMSDYIVSITIINELIIPSCSLEGRSCRLGGGCE